MAASHPMTLIQPPFRRATLDDAAALAEFVELASEGLATYLWSRLGGPGRDPWSVGRERVCGEAGGLSYRNAIVTELAARPVAGLISYPLADKPEPITDKLPAMLVPLHIRKIEERARALHFSPWPTA
jgi:hypothetical protein